MFRIICHLGIVVVFLCAQAAALPPIEAYGELPDVRQLSLSTDGSKVAYVTKLEGDDLMVVYDLQEGPVFALNVNDLNVRGLDFASEKYVILNASEVTRVYGFRGEFDYSAAFSINLETNKAIQLLSRYDDLYPAQSGLGRIVGKVANENQVFMPGLGKVLDNPPLNLIRADLDTGRGRLHRRGRSDTIGWLVDTDGTILARIDYDNRRDHYEIYTRRSGDWELVLELEDVDQIPIGVLGVKEDRSALIVQARKPGEDFEAIYELDFAGNYSSEIFFRDDADPVRVLSDANNIVYGVEYGGLYPTYDFYNPDLKEIMDALQAFFPESSVYLKDWTEGFEELLLFITGGDTSGQYVVYSKKEKDLTRVAKERERIPAEFVAPTNVIEYEARDGLTIPSIITWPLNVTEDQRRNLPLIVMPHGGPESYDSVQFDWMAQYFASRGYLVLQPNFRGSDGFGRTFRNAGRGEWGRKMQDDVSDGVSALIRGGYADPQRVCIIGASYGGYSALSGGAFTPELYKCVAAIAPVSDLPRMLLQQERDYGRNHWVVSYWNKLIGDRREEIENLRTISPVNYAESFKAPVLLIHGDDDVIVPFSQSRRMESALKRAGKSVELVRLKGEDHYLSAGETRLSTLKALDRFVLTHLGPGVVPAN